MRGAAVVTRCPRAGVSALIVIVASVGASARQMPDARQMSGVPLPVAEMPAGTVTVRLVRGSVSNPITGEQVEIHGAGAPRTARTNEAGRAEFKGLPIGGRLQATAIIGGQRLESQEFTLPTEGGVRLMLVAADGEAERRAAEDRKLAEGPAQPGSVVLGSESRFVFELGDDGLSVFNIFQVLNSARAPVQTPEPLVFDLPENARGATILQGSSPQATAAGRRITVTGPFAPGTTLVQFVYTLPYASPDLTIQQKLPAALNQLSVAAQKVGDLDLSSPQITRHNQARSEGQTYIVGQGPALKTGDVVTFKLTGLPYVSMWPRNIALALAVIILAAGAWASVRSGSGNDAARRHKLETQRDRLFSELTALEQQQREGSVDAERYAARRRELVVTLERVYAELDEEGVTVGRAS